MKLSNDAELDTDATIMSQTSYPICLQCTPVCIPWTLCMGCCSQTAKWQSLLVTAIIVSGNRVNYQYSDTSDKWTTVNNQRLSDTDTQLCHRKKNGVHAAYPTTKKWGSSVNSCMHYGQLLWQSKTFNDQLKSCLFLNFFLKQLSARVWHCWVATRLLHFWYWSQ